MSSDMAFAMFWLFAIVSGRGLPNDLASLIDADEYFQARHIAVTADRLAELAGKKPADGRDQISQLLAIRYLGEHVEMAQNARVHDVLEEVAAGKKGTDAEGFARDYARRALDRLAGRPPDRHPLNDPGTWSDSFTWLPQRVTLVVAHDQRKLPPPQTEDDRILRAALAVCIPKNAHEEMFKFIDSTGNLRSDRFVLGMFEDPGDPQRTEVFVRLTGLGDRKRLVEAIRHSGIPPGELKEEKGPRGEPITLLLPNNNFGVGLAVVGNTDLFFAVYPGPGKSADLIREVVKVWRGGQPNALKGISGNKLKAIPRGACAFVIGDLPETMRNGMQRDLQIAGLPQQVIAYLAKGRGVSVRLEGVSQTAADAELFAGNIVVWKDRGIAALQNLPTVFQIQPDSLRRLIKELEGLKIDVKDRTVIVTLTLSVAAQNIVQKAVGDSLQKLAEASQKGGR